MAGWLKRPREQEETIHPGDEAMARVPASARGPEANRFTPLGSDMPDGTDEDLDLIQSLLSEVERDETAKRRTEAPKVRENSPNARKSTTEDLEIFRSLQSQGDVTLRHNFRVASIDMADLLDELSVTAAALQRRKAA
jgi:hypothetical protein